MTKLRPVYSGVTCIIIAFLVFPSSLSASFVSVDLGPSHTITSETPPASFDSLNGTPLDGQSVSLDFSFSNNEFVRIFSVTSYTFQASIELGTNGSGLLGYLQGTGYLIDINGNAIPGFGITGSASGNDGSLELSLFPLLKDKDGTPNTDLIRPFDFYGIHYDLVLPNADDIFVTDGELTLLSNPGVFGIGPGIQRDIVPDSGDTLLLLGVSVVFIFSLRHWRKKVSF